MLMLQGAKMALIWSKMTTGMPFQIVTAQVGQQFRSEYTLDMDIHKNEPHVHAVAVSLQHHCTSQVNEAFSFRPHQMWQVTCLWR